MNHLPDILHKFRANLVLLLLFVARTSEEMAIEIIDLPLPTLARAVLRSLGNLFVIYGIIILRYSCAAQMQFGMAHGNCITYLYSIHRLQGARRFSRFGPMLSVYSFERRKERISELYTRCWRVLETSLGRNFHIIAEERRKN